MAGHVIYGTPLHLLPGIFGKGILSPVPGDPIPLVSAFAQFGADVNVIAADFRAKYQNASHTTSVSVGDNPIRDMYFLGLERQGLTTAGILKRYRQDFPELFPEQPGIGDLAKQAEYDNRTDPEMDLKRKGIRRMEKGLDQALKRSGQ